MKTQSMIHNSILHYVTIGYGKKREQKRIVEFSRKIL